MKKVKVLVLQSQGLCVSPYSLCDSMDCSPPASLFMEFSRQEYWCGQPFPSPGHLPDPRIKPGFLALQMDSLLSGPLEKLIYIYTHIYIYLFIFVYACIYRYIEKFILTRSVFVTYRFMCHPLKSKFTLLKVQPKC